MKYNNSVNFKKCFLGFLILISISAKIYGQNKLLKPTINYTVNTNIISQQPTGTYIHKTADYFGIEISLYKGQYSVDNGISSSKIFESVKKMIIDFNLEYPSSKLFYSDEKINKLELSDTLHTNFLQINTLNPIKLIWYHQIDTLKNEAELILKFYDLTKKIKSIPIPSDNSNNTTKPIFSIYINPIPVLGITSIEKYDNELVNNLISKLSSIKEKLEREQVFETNLSAEVVITKASLFSIFLYKNMTLKLISK
jgi:hypothetical protein